MKSNEVKIVITQKVDVVNWDTEDVMEIPCNRLQEMGYTYGTSLMDWIQPEYDHRGSFRGLLMVVRDTQFREIGERLGITREVEAISDV